MKTEDYFDLLAPGNPEAASAACALAPSVLRLLHRIAITDSRQMSGALNECLWLFGPEACYHLVGILHESMLDSDDRWMLAEIVARLVPGLSAEFAPIVEEWTRETGRADEPRRRPFEEVRVLLDELREARRARNRIEQTLQDVAEWRATEHARVVIEQFKAVTDGVKMSGDDSPLCDAWEEYKDQIQGQESVFFGLYVFQIRQLAQTLVEELPPQEQMLLWMGTRDFEDLEVEDMIAVNPEVLLDFVCKAVDRVADNEELRDQAMDWDEEEWEEEDDWEEQDEEELHEREEGELG